MRGQPAFFDIDDRLKRLSDLGDQLETFRSAVDFELLQPELNAALKAVLWPSTPCVPVKTDDQLDLQALYRVRSRLVGQRTAVINQIRKKRGPWRTAMPRSKRKLRI